MANRVTDLPLISLIVEIHLNLEASSFGVLRAGVRGYDKQIDLISEALQYSLSEHDK